ncbi:MAG: hypothetical protein LBG58_17175 [Planctomycetaceae bacterium]|jgi:hypothetical protein|nr:hypothetical protein [Planctomycetaceae bacterium]
MKLPSFIQQEIENEVSPLAERFYNAIKIACDKFSAEYPDVSIDRNKVKILNVLLLPRH